MPNEQSKKKLLLLLLLLAGGIFAGVLSLRQRLVKPKAAPGTPALSFASSVSPLVSGNPFDLTVKVNPNGTTFNAFELRFNFDQTKVGLVNPANVSANISKLYSSQLALSASLSGNTVVITGAKTGDPFSGTADINLVKVAMKAEAAASGIAVFAWDNATEIEGKVPELTQGQFNISGDVASAKLYFTSPKTYYTWGENVNLDLFLDTAGKQVSSVQFEFYYQNAGGSAYFTLQNPTSTNLEQDNIELDPSSGFDTGNPLNSIDTTTQKVIVGLVAGSSPVTGNKKLATVKLKVKTGAPLGAFSFVPSDTSRVYDGQTQNILGQKPAYQLNTVVDVIPSVTIVPSISVFPTVTSVPSITPTPTPACPIVAASCQATKGKGDADCDGAITACDFTIWSRELKGEKTGGNADFNGDGKVDMADFEIWRRSYYGSSLPTAVITAYVTRQITNPPPTIPTANPTTQPPTATSVPPRDSSPTPVKPPTGGDGTCPTSNRSYTCITSTYCRQFGGTAVPSLRCSNDRFVCCQMGADR